MIFFGFSGKGREELKEGKKRTSRPKRRGEGATPNRGPSRQASKTILSRNYGGTIIGLYAKY